MEKSEEIKTLYIGLHPQTLRWLNKESINVVGVTSLGSDYFYKFSINPANFLFQLLYFLQEKRISRALILTVFWLWYPFSIFCTQVFKKYKNYLTELIQKNIQIIDISDIPKTVSFINRNDIKLIVVNLWSILPKEIVGRQSTLAINIHPSKLPEYKGALPTLWSLKNKDRSSAVTFITMDTGIDTGLIISQYEFNIEPSNCAIDLERKIDLIIEKNILKDIQLYLKNKIIPRTQSGSGSTTGKYEDYKKINWVNEKAIDIVNKIQLYPYLEPFAFCFAEINGRKIYIKNASVAKNKKLERGSFLFRLHKIFIGTAEDCVSFVIFKDISPIDSLFLLFTKNTYKQSI